MGLKKNDTGLCTANPDGAIATSTEDHITYKTAPFASTRGENARGRDLIQIGPGRAVNQN